MTSFLNEEEVKELGLGSVGKNVSISRFCSIYSAASIHIGDNVRIDDFSILSGNIEIGNFVHIAAGVYLYAGKSKIIIKDFSSISSQSSVYAITDDFVGGYLVNPTIPDKYRNVLMGEVILEQHVVIGTHSVVLPNVIIGTGATVGAMSLVSKNLDPWGVYVGIPCKKINNRDKKNVIAKEAEFQAEITRK